VFGCLVVGWETWNAHLNAEPSLTIPAPPTLPSPNSYDDLVRIANQNVEPSSELWNSTTPTPMSGVSGAPPSGAPLLGGQPPPGGPPGITPSGTPPALPAPKPIIHHNTDGERRAALAKAEPALNALRTVLVRHIAYRQPDHKAESANPKFLSLARSLEFEARLRERDGDAVGAAESALIAIPIRNSGGE